MFFFALETPNSLESMLLAGMGILAGVVAMFWRIYVKSNERLTQRADNCEVEHKKCQIDRGETKTEVAVLRVELGHLRELLGFRNVMNGLQVSGATDKPVVVNSGQDKEKEISNARTN